MSELPPLPGPVDLMQTIYGDRDRPIGDFYPAASVRAWRWTVRRAALEEAARVVQANALACEPGSMLSVYLASNAAAIRALAEPVTLPVPPVAP